ncbi:MAG: 3-phosphoshikimate 1-carboxyvinyltransferase [Chloroflexi bacterium]|nr:3-phosphoshikimate 1-carboxyvinyltransferase [Chloroflexota bacterium]
MMPVTISGPRRLRGEITAPGDKSVSHRAAMFNAIANGGATLTNFSPGADCSSTLDILRALGVEIDRGPGESGMGDTVHVRGVGMHGLEEPSGILDAGNSGTTTRLMSGVLAGRDIFTVLTGDDSIRSRPMGRVVAPLRAMGADIFGRKNNTLAPLAFAGGRLRGVRYEMPVASAQLKSSLLLAGLRADGKTELIQPAQSRDHTERMLTAMGARISTDGLTVSVEPSELSAVDVYVPGDISSAAFWMVAGLVHPDAEIVIRGVGINPTRSGVIDALKMMNADISLENERDAAGEPVADIVVRSSRLRGTVIAGDIVPLLIDEIPVLAVAAAMAEGETRFEDAGELRVKETDRIAATAEWMTAAGVKVETSADCMTIEGVGRLLGGSFNGHHDHRIAMSEGIAGLISESPVTINGAEIASISYPQFWQEIEKLGGVVE